MRRGDDGEFDPAADTLLTVSGSTPFYAAFTMITGYKDCCSPCFRSLTCVGEGEASRTRQRTLCMIPFSFSRFGSSTVSFSTFLPTSLSLSHLSLSRKRQFTLLQNMSDYTSIDDSQSFSSHDVLFLGVTDQVQPWTTQASVLKAFVLGRITYDSEHGTALLRPTTRLNSAQSLPAKNQPGARRCRRRCRCRCNRISIELTTSLPSFDSLSRLIGEED